MPLSALYLEIKKIPQINVTVEGSPTTARPAKRPVEMMPRRRSFGLFMADLLDAERPDWTRPRRGASILVLGATG
jgi:hypothetical protein